ncbi:MAG: nickel pincer cofactor biosynthesis protein LarC [Synergistaceae bacterium]|nr:nickel pincer cofactor biosynthesis protein LarC [Synergistaceae bacterium]
MSGLNGEKIIYLNPCSGISGDMFLGAMIDIMSKIAPGFDISSLLGKISIGEYEATVTRGTRGGISGLKLNVHDRHHDHDHDYHHHRNLTDIMKILEISDIPDDVRERSAEAFTILANAEARVHSRTVGEIHFHEVGAVDSIIDITGAMLVMGQMGWPRVFSSPVNVGSGTVKCAHGILPVPAPATAELLEGLKIFSAGEPMERTTPTGALLLKLLVGQDGFRDIPEGRVICGGTGLGARDTKSLPNVLRAMLIESDSAEKTTARFEYDEPFLIETNIDDMNPQDFSMTEDRLFADGALDVWRENILMKKGRQATKLCCLVRAGDAEKFAEKIMLETTTLGVRITQKRRIMLERRFDTVETSLGNIGIKSAVLDGRVIRSIPEYDEIAAMAKRSGISPSEVRRIVEGDICRKG